MFDVRHDLSPGCSIGVQLISDHPHRCDALLIQKAGQQLLGSLDVAAVLNNFVKHKSVLIEGPPEPVCPARYGDDDLVQMPHIVPARLLAAKPTRIIRAELLSPATDRFIGHGNAALQQQFLDKSQAQRKPKVEQDRVGDDLRWETMAVGEPAEDFQGKIEKLKAQFNPANAVNRLLYRRNERLMLELVAGGLIAQRLVRNRTHETAIRVVGRPAQLWSYLTSFACYSVPKSSPLNADRIPRLSCSCILVSCLLFNFDDATILQRKDAVSAIKDAIIVGNEQCSSTPYLTHTFQKIDNLGRTVLVQRGRRLIG